MRFLKRQSIDRRSPGNTTLYSDTARANVYVSPVGNGSLVVPSGTNAQRPGSPVVGMIRYNTDAVTNGQLEVYSAGRWRALRFAEQGPITQQNLGAGDGTNLYFGPLNSTYYNPGNNANGATVSGQNIIVVVENVIQLATTNYTVVQNPTIPAQSYTGATSFAATVGSTTLYFNTSIDATGGSGNTTTVTLTFGAKTQIPFAIGSNITVTGFAPLGYNGVFTVTSSTTSSVSYANTTSATITTLGNIQSTGATPAIYPDNTIIGATITGSANLQAGTLVSSYITDSTTGALVSMVISKATVTATIPVNTVITVTESGLVGSGYFLQFTAPVPYGRIVTALLGFDS